MLCVVARLEHDLADVEALKDLKQELRLQKEVSPSVPIPASVLGPIDWCTVQSGL